MFFYKICIYQRFFCNFVYGKLELPRQEEKPEPADISPEKFYLIPLDTLSRFKRVGHKFLPHYIIENPRQNLRNHMHDWFYNADIIELSGMLIKRK